MTPIPMAKALQGYTWVSWPDLAADRLPCNEINIQTFPLSVVISESIHPSALVLGVTARALAAYCGVSDVLVAVYQTEIQHPTYVRIQWDSQTSWAAIVLSIREQLQITDTGVGPKQVQEFLGLGEEQNPELFCWTELSLSLVGDNKILLSFDPVSSNFSIRASKKLLHPSISQQLASQVEWLLGHASRRLATAAADMSDIPPHLASTFSRTSSKDLGKVYSHAPAVRLATDYLKLRAQAAPTAIAVQWYPSLSSDAELPVLYDAITYADLDKQANKLARWLVDQGLDKEDKVAVCMNRNVLFHVVMMGILRSGGCYVPVDPELPEERKSYIARDSGAKFVLTTHDISPPELFGQPTIYVNTPEFLSAVEAQDETNVDFATPDALSYMLYTSGTTGNPKGCLLTQQGLASAILSLSYWASKVRMSDFSKGRYLSIASIAFDVHIAEIFVPLALGMPILSAPRSQLLENLPVHVRALGITHLGLVPSLIEATMNAVEEDGDNVVLRYIASGGEKISDTILDKWANHPQTVLANFYGPSEATIGCCATLMSPNTPRTNIGRPFANVSAYVVDTDMNIILRGGIGELVVEGPLIGRGYHARQDLTQKVFKAWPNQDCCAYRTGDLVRMMPDSTIEILGRIDTQIKLRGVRIESEGISAIVRKALAPSPTVSLDAVTVLAKHPSIGVQQLVTFFSWDPSVSVLVRKSKRPQLATPPSGFLKRIREVCETELASYMRPSHIIPLNWLPLSSNGKADEKTLISLFAGLEIGCLTALIDDEGKTAEVTKPLTEMERTVWDVLQPHVLFKEVYAHSETNVFELGLDSMGAVRFAAALRQRLGCNTRASDIMKTPTLEGISALLEADMTTSAGIPPLPKLFSQPPSEVLRDYPKGTIEGVFPPFAIQEGVLSRSAVDNTLYVQHIVLLCNPEISMLRLRTAWTAMQARHTILRTVFHFGKVLSQVVQKPEVCSLSWNEKPSDQTSTKDFLQWFHARESTVITISLNRNSHSQPPFALTVYHTSFGRVLVLSIHHAIYDGISLPLILEGIERTYTGISLVSSPNTPEVSNYLTSLNQSDARSFWLDHFNNYEWPALVDVGNIQSSTSGSCKIPLRTRPSELKNLISKQRVTLQSLFTAAFATLLSSALYSKSDVAFGVIRSGRLLPLDRVSDSLCPLITVLPLRLHVDAPNLLQTVQNWISGTVEHEHVPLGKVQNWVRPGKPLFDTLFSVSLKDDKPSEIWNVIESNPPRADYLLSTEIVVSTSQDTILIQCAWLADILDSATMVDLFEKFESILLMIASGNRSVPVRGLIRAETSGSSTEPAVSHADGHALSPSLDLRLVEKLRSIIAEFLGVDKIILGNSTSFISLGLDSIKSVGLARALQRQGFKASPNHILRFSTLELLATALTSANASLTQDDQIDPLYHDFLQRLQGSVNAQALALGTGDKIAIYPTTALQAGMLSRTIGSEGKLYVHAFPLFLSPIVDIARLRSSWFAVVERLSVLRTSFHFDNDLGIWFQAVHSLNTLDWTQVTSDSLKDSERKLTDFVQETVFRREADFRKPPLRVRLVQSVSPDAHRHCLVFILHHALYDGVSIGKLLDILEKVYHGAYLAKPVQFSELVPRFFYQEHKGTSFWLQKLLDYRHFPLPCIQKPTSFHTLTAVKEIRVEPVKLSAILSRAQVTVQCVAQAAWSKLISSITGACEVMFGHIVSGRSLAGASDVIGPVLNTIPCRVQLRGRTNIDLLRKIHEDNVDALPWQQASLRAIQRQLGLESLWDNIFSFQSVDQISEQHELWEFRQMDNAEIHTQYALSVEFNQTRDGFLVRCAARPDFSQSSSLDEMLKQLQEIMENILDSWDALALEDSMAIVTAGTPDTTSLHVTEENVYGTRTVSVESEDNKVHVILRDLVSSLARLPAEIIDKNTPLVSLGIDSITAIQISNKARHAGIGISTTQIIGCRNFGDLVKRAQSRAVKATKSATPESLPQLSPREINGIISRFGTSSPLERILPTSPGQKFFIAGWQGMQARKYQHVFMFLLPPDVDKARLKVAWILLLQRHPLLRSTFANEPRSSEPRIIVFKNEVAPSTWSEEVSADDIFYQATAARVRNLAENPPSSRLPQARAILRHSEKKSTLLLHLHHFQYDAWSLSLLCRDLDVFYESQSVASVNDLTKYLSRTASTPEKRVIQDQYWNRVIPRRFKPTLFPKLNPASSSRNSRSICVVKTAIEGVALCEERASDLQISLHAILVACWARLQGKYTGMDDICFGIWQNGRTGSMEVIDRLAVPCVNILPMFVQGACATVTTTATRVQEILTEQVGIIEHTEFWRCNELRGINEPLTNVFLNVFRSSPRGQTSGLLEPVNLPYESPATANFDFSSTMDHLPITDLIKDELSVDVIIIPDRDAICVAIDASTALLDDEQAARIVDEYSKLVKQTLSLV